jgi:hypothetical protein
MKNLENYGVIEMDDKEMRLLSGGWWVKILQGIAYLASMTVALNDYCDQCITERIAESDSSLGGSRPFE